MATKIHQKNTNIIQNKHMRACYHKVVIPTGLELSEAVRWCMKNMV